jgi:phospholipase/carboxylesterase
VSYLARTSLVDGGPALEAAGLVHRVLQPALAGPHPTIVMLHGLGGDGSAMWLLGPALPRGWLVVSPRAPLVDPDGGYAWRPHAPGEWPPLDTFDPSIAAVEQFAGALPALYGADPDAVYLMGFSQGAALSLATAMRRPGLVRGVASIVGFLASGATTDDLAAVRGLPVFMAVGQRDRLVPHAFSEGTAAALREAGADLEYHAYDVGHKLGSTGMQDLLAWFMQRSEADVAGVGASTRGPLEPIGRVRRWE